MYYSKNIAVVIPAYNEQASIGKVVSELRELEFEGQKVVDQIVVCNNNSSDRTGDIAAFEGAKVVYEFRQGYGYACQRAISRLDEARTDYVVFVDADYSVKTSELLSLLDRLYLGADLVVGTRNNDLLETNALTPQQRFGNVFAAFLVRLFWNRRIADLGPFRAIKFSVLQAIDMRDKRYGWTIEMQVKALIGNFRYDEVPVTTRCRIGKSKISGTLKGTIGAGFGIVGKIVGLFVIQSRLRTNFKQALESKPVEA